METAEGQGDLIRTWYQEMPQDLDQYLVILQFSVIFHEFCSVCSSEFGHYKYFSHLRRQTTVGLFFKKAFILHLNLFRMTYEALKHHGFDRPPRPPSNSCYSRSVTCIIYPGDEFKTELESATDLIIQHHSKIPVAPSFVAASAQQAWTSSFGITSLGPLSHNSSFTLPPALPSAAVQTQASGTQTTSTLPVSSQDLFLNKDLNQFNAAIRQLMHGYSQLQLTNLLWL